MTKLLIIVFFVIIILALVMIFFFRNQQASPAPGWINQKTDQYTVSYPKEWVSNESSLASNKGSSNLIKSKENSPEAPIISIQAVDSSVTSVARIEDSFKQFHYTKSTITIDGITATKFSGSIPASMSGNIKPEQEVDAVLTKQKTIYLLKLSYYSDHPIAMYEEIFSNLVQ